jgi:hypothetical protein
MFAPGLLSVCTLAQWDACNEIFVKKNNIMHTCPSPCHSGTVNYKAEMRILAKKKDEMRKNGDFGTHPWVKLGHFLLVAHWSYKKLKNDTHMST